MDKFERSFGRMTKMIYGLWIMAGLCSIGSGLFICWVIIKLL